MTIKYENDGCEIVDEMYNYPCAIRLTERGDDTYEVFTKDDRGNYVHIPVASVTIQVLGDFDGMLWQKVTPEYWESFGKDLPFPQEETDKEVWL